MKPGKRNPVAKFAHVYNRCRVMRDRKAAAKRGERQKHRRLDIPIAIPLGNSAEGVTASGERDGLHDRIDRQPAAD